MDENKKIKILIIEDSKILRRTLREEISEILGGKLNIYFCVSFSKAEKFIEIQCLKKKKINFDLIILDYELGDGHGDDLIFSIKNLHPSAILLFSSFGFYETTKFKQALEEKKVDYHCSKDNLMDKLLPILISLRRCV